MFLGVSDTLACMTDDTWRADLAERVRRQRRRIYGTKARAYQAAGLNATTWGRIEAGQSVREASLLAAVRALWPSTEGDWTRIPDDDEPPASHTVEERLADLEQRVERLERATHHREEHDHGDSAATSQAEVSSAGREVTSRRARAQTGPHPAPTPPPTGGSPRRGRT